MDAGTPEAISGIPNAALEAPLTNAWSGDVECADDAGAACQKEPELGDPT